MILCVLILGPMLKPDDIELKIMSQQNSVSKNGYPISSFAQFYILLKRCTLCINRDNVSELV